MRGEAAGEARTITFRALHAPPIGSGRLPFVLFLHCLD